MIRGINHVGISVANLERSIRFYEDVLGMKVSGQGTFAGEQFERILRLQGATGKSAMLRKEGLLIELFEFSHPTPKPGDANRPVCDHGITHFCIDVVGIEAEYERLKAKGVSFHCPPLDFLGIAKATYARDPDGNVFELLEAPAQE